MNAVKYSPLRRRCISFGRKHPRLLANLHRIDTLIDYTIFKVKPTAMKVTGVALMLFLAIFVVALSAFSGIYVAAETSDAAEQIIANEKAIEKALYPRYIAPPVMTPTERTVYRTEYVEVEVPAPKEPGKTWVIRDCDVPTDMDNSFKAYMSADKITNKSSDIYRFKDMYTGTQNGIYMVGDRYVVALGTYYTGDEIGRMFDITLDTGEVINVITGEIKNDIHTDAKNQYRYCHDDIVCVVEFVVDTDELDPTVLRDGDLSSDPSGLFSGEIVEIREVTVVQ